MSGVYTSKQALGTERGVYMLYQLISRYYKLVSLAAFSFTSSLLWHCTVHTTGCCASGAQGSPVCCSHDAWTLFTVLCSLNFIPAETLENSLATRCRVRNFVEISKWTEKFYRYLPPGSEWDVRFFCWEKICFLCWMWKLVRYTRLYIEFTFIEHVVDLFFFAFQPEIFQ